MKMRRYEILEFFIGCGLLILFLPVLAVISSVFIYMAQNLAALIKGEEEVLSHIGKFILAVLVQGLYAYVCYRKEKLQFFYVCSILFSILVVLVAAPSDSIIANIITAAIAVSTMLFGFRGMAFLERRWNIKGKPTRKQIDPFEQHIYKETLRKLPSDYRLFWHYCSSLPKGEAQRIAKDLPMVFFHNIPCREALEYIYKQNPSNAILLVKYFIKFDTNGRPIMK